MKNNIIKKKYFIFFKYVLSKFSYFFILILGIMFLYYPKINNFYQNKIKNKNIQKKNKILNYKEIKASENIQDLEYTLTEFVFDEANLTKKYYSIITGKKIKEINLNLGIVYYFEAQKGRLIKKHIFKKEEIKKTKNNCLELEDVLNLNSIPEKKFNFTILYSIEFDPLTGHKTTRNLFSSDGKKILLIEKFDKITGFPIEKIVFGLSNKNVEYILKFNHPNN
jgi:hypothetical protein